MRKTVHCYCNLQNAIENYPYKFLDRYRDGQRPKIGLRHNFPGRAVRYLPAPPQIRTSGFPAYGSSNSRVHFKD